MDSIKGRDIVTWAILIGILWEVSRQSPAPAFSYGAIDSCCDPCAMTINKNIQQNSQTPYWIAQFGAGYNKRWTFEAS